MKPQTGHEAFKPLEFEPSTRHIEANRKFKEDQIALVDDAINTRKKLTLLTYKARKRRQYYEAMNYEEGSHFHETRTVPAIRRLSYLRSAAKHLTIAIDYMRKARGRL